VDEGGLVADLVLESPQHFSLLPPACIDSVAILFLKNQVGLPQHYNRACGIAGSGLALLGNPFLALWPKFALFERHDNNTDWGFRQYLGPSN